MNTATTTNDRPFAQAQEHAQELVDALVQANTNATGNIYAHLLFIDLILQARKIAATLNTINDQG